MELIKKMKKGLGCCIQNQKSRFLNIFSKTISFPKLNTKLRRNLTIVVSGTVLFFIVGNLIYVLKAKALDSRDLGLFQIIISEMKAQNKLRDEWNGRIIFKQKIASYGVTACSVLQPLIPSKKYRILYRLNSGFNILLNSYMLLLDFYRK